jgi:hypothetical protein
VWAKRKGGDLREREREGERGREGERERERERWELELTAARGGIEGERPNEGFVGIDLGAEQGFTSYHLRHGTMNLCSLVN